MTASAAPTIATDPGLALAPWSGAADAEEHQRWLAVADEVALRLAVDVVDRDRAGRPPVAEVALLRESGLVDLLVPRGLGGQGAHWSTAFAVARRLARTDASIAQIFGYSLLNEACVAFYAIDEARAERWLRRSAAEHWIWSDSFNPVSDDLALEHRDGRYVLNGLKRFATGAATADRVIAGATAAGGELDDEFVLFAVDPRAAGVTHLDDWDHLGQRASASGSIRYDDVEVLDADIVGIDRGTPFSALVTPGVQLLFGSIYVGVAEGALAQARQLTRARKNSWFLSGVDRYADDPIVHRVLGELVAKTAAAGALADQLAREFEQVVAIGPEATADDRAAIAVAVAGLKVVSTEVGLDVSSRVFEVTGASSTSADIGLDLHWRNVRTHSLHDPVDYKKIEVGAHFLNGTVQPVSLYT